MPDDDRFLLLNDLPVEDRAADLLGTADVAGKLADLIHGSRSNTPFVLAIDGRWGTGKSTLMRQLANALGEREQVEVVWFNAWTASGANALNGMVRLVLDRLLLEENIRGENLLSFGDGPVEIIHTREVGGLAVAVASDEEHNGSGRMHPQKRRQLVEAEAIRRRRERAD